MWEEIFNYKEPEQRAAILSLRFLSEVEKVCEERGINRKQLAKALGTSASYITQLYRGDKIVNLLFIARLENTLDIRFETHIQPAPSAQ